jgi:hypothetical protein
MKFSGEILVSGVIYYSSYIDHLGYQLAAPLIGEETGEKLA